MVAKEILVSRYSVPAVRAVQNGQELFQFFLPVKLLQSLPVKVEPYDPDKGETDPDGKSIFNYDGQHRALGYLFRYEGNEPFGEFAVPIVMTRGMAKLNETTQFQTINSKAKGVPTALVNAILAKMQATEGDDAIDPSAHRNVVCYKVTEAVNSEPGGPWQNLIALPNQKQWTKRDVAEEPSREHARVLKADSFVDALRPVYNYVTTHNFASTLDERTEVIAGIVNEFWSALKAKLPKAFARPNDYALFKSGGVGPMHLVLRDRLAKMHSGRRAAVKEQFLTMLDGSDLLGTAEFWESSNADGAGIYSGKANWPDLAKRIIRDVDEGTPA